MCYDLSGRKAILRKIRRWRRHDIPEITAGGEAHEHAHEHVSGHHHEHGDTPELTPEQTLALMSYMLEHNRSHAEELHGVAHALEHQGKPEAAKLVSEAVHWFGHCNDRLEEALRLVKGE